MFKKGQLVESELSHYRYVVLIWPQALCLHSSCVVTLNVNGVWTLIGNNYRPLAPGARAKRRYNEMAAKVARGEAGYQPAVKSPLSKSCGDKFGDMPKLR